MSQVQAIKLLLPGIFLLVLGLGNIIVGHFKGQQYDRVLSELAPSSLSTELINVSPMRRMQLEREAATRLDERRGRAMARRDFYRLVSFGGQSFVVLSLLFFCCAFASRHFQKRREASGVTSKKPARSEINSSNDPVA